MSTYQSLQPAAGKIEGGPAETSPGNRLFELRDLDILMEVARAGSFRGAAYAFGVEPSMVSRRIRALEDRLGASLFERRRSGVRATDAGRQFQGDVRAVLARLDSAVRMIQTAGQAGVGRIDIGVISSLSSRFAGWLISCFRDSCPGVELTFVEGGYQEHATAIIDGSLDLALVLGTPKLEGCESERLWTEPVLAALPSQDTRARAPLLRLTALSEDHFIVSYDPPGPEVHDFIIRRLSDESFHPRISQHRVGREGLLSLVGLSFGISLVCGAEKRVSYPNVTFVRLDGEHVPISAIWSPRNDNPALRRFLSLARRLSREEEQVSAGARTRDPSP